MESKGFYDINSLRHFFSGILLYIFGFSFFWSVIISLIFEVLENIPYLRYMFAEENDQELDDAVNATTDSLFLIFGWVFAALVSKGLHLKNDGKLFNIPLPDPTK